MTHDLLRDVLQALGSDLERITINDLQDGVFFATLHFVSGVEVSARPSDAIALAMRMDIPVFGSEAVLDEAGITVPDEGQADEEGEVEKFREFLDNISPEDFNTGS
jgi:bifunctional DNase/RNase